MDKEISILAEQLGMTLKNEEDAEKLITILKNKLKYYQDKNAQNEEWISKLKVAPQNLNTESQNKLRNIANIIETSCADSLDISDIGLSFLDTTEKKYLYNKKYDNLKEMQSQYIKQISNLEEESKIVEEEIKVVQQQVNQIDSVSDVEINSLKGLVKKYQDTVDELVEKNTWIHREEYNSLSIQEELKKLHKLRNDADKLRNEIEVFKGLKPDLELARKQLCDIKKEYEIMHNEYKTFSK